MATTPTASAMLAMSYLRDMIAASSTFQTWVGADDAAEAAASVWYESLPLPGSNAEVYSSAEVAGYWPYAIIGIEDYYIRPTAAAGSEQDGGAFVVELCGLADDSSNDPSETALKFGNVVFQIIADVMGLREQASYLDISGVQLMDGPTRSHPEDITTARDELTTHWRFTWGVQ